MTRLASACGAAPRAGSDDLAAARAAGVEVGASGSAGTKGDLEDAFLALVAAGGFPEPLVNTHVEGEEADCCRPDHVVHVLSAWPQRRRNLRVDPRLNTWIAGDQSHRVLRRLLPLALLSLLTPGSAAAKGQPCSAGHTIWSHGHARIFSTAVKYPAGTLHRFYLCSKTVRHPRLFDDDEDVDASFGHWRASGRYVAYAVSWEDGVEAGWDARWVDLATGETRVRGIEPDTPIEPGEPQALAVDGDGAIAFLETGGEHKAVIGWVPNGVYACTALDQLTTLDEPVVPSSLSFVDGVIAWTTEAGAASSVRVR